MLTYTRSLVRAVFICAFFICAQFQNTPKYLVHADFTFYGSESPSFMRKRWELVCINNIDFISAFLLSTYFSVAQKTHHARTWCMTSFNYFCFIKKKIFLQKLANYRNIWHCFIILNWCDNIHKSITFDSFQKYIH